MLRTENISYIVGKKQILKNISLEFAPGEFNMILGPNGSGKSSFLKIFCGEIPDHQGHVYYENNELGSLKKEALARKRAVMSQQPELNFPLSVEEVVMMGRYPHFTFDPHANDIKICNEVIERMTLQSFRERNYLTLSGGEKQRVQFARVLAQVWEIPSSDTRFLFLDEPLTSLDISYQQEFLQIVKSFLQERTVIAAVIHDINLAIQFADKLFFFKDGELAALGKPSAILTEKLIEDIFGVKTTIINNPVTGSPLVVYN